MGAYQRYIQYRKDELYHFNPNHDPKDGKFTFAKGVRKIKNAANKVVRWIDGQDELDAIMAKKEAAQRDEKNSSESIRPSTHEEELNDLIEMEKNEETARDPDLISPYHEMDGRFIPDPSKTRVIPPGNRGALQEYMIEYVPGKGLFESERDYRKREFDIEKQLYRQYADTSSIKDLNAKRNVESQLFKEARLGNRDPVSYNAKPGDDMHNTSVAMAVRDNIVNTKAAQTISNRLWENAPLRNELIPKHTTVWKYNETWAENNISNKDVSNVINESIYENTEESRKFVKDLLIKEHVDRID